MTLTIIGMMTVSISNVSVTLEVRRHISLLLMDLLRSLNTMNEICRVMILIIVRSVVLRQIVPFNKLNTFHQGTSRRT